MNGDDDLRCVVQCRLDCAAMYANGSVSFVPSQFLFPRVTVSEGYYRSITTIVEQGEIYLIIRREKEIFLEKIAPYAFTE